MVGLLDLMSSLYGIPDFPGDNGYLQIPKKPVLPIDGIDPAVPISDASTHGAPIFSPQPSAAGLASLSKQDMAPNAPILPDTGTQTASNAPVNIPQSSDSSGLGLMGQYGQAPSLQSLGLMGADDPSQKLVNMGMGLMAAGGNSRMPKTFGQTIAEGYQYANQQNREDTKTALENAQALASLRQSMFPDTQKLADVALMKVNMGITPAPAEMAALKTQNTLNQAKLTYTQDSKTGQWVAHPGSASLLTGLPNDVMGVNAPNTPNAMGQPNPTPSAPVISPQGQPNIGLPSISGMNDPNANVSSNQAALDAVGKGTGEQINNQNLLNVKRPQIDAALQDIQNFIPKVGEENLKPVANSTSTLMGISYPDIAKQRGSAGQENLDILKSKIAGAKELIKGAVAGTGENGKWTDTDQKNLDAMFPDLGGGSKPLLSAIGDIRSKYGNSQNTQPALALPPKVTPNDLVDGQIYQNGTKTGRWNAKEGHFEVVQ